MKSIVLTLVILCSISAKAGLWDNHLSPTLEDGFDQKGLLIIGGGLLAIAIAQPNDYHVREQFSEHRKMSSSTARIGDYLGTGIPGSLIALAQLYWDSENGYAHAEALIDSALVTFALKFADGRGRPNSENKLSMPSGHTSTTFTTATSLAYAYGLKAAVPAYLAATFTAATRWSDDAHWFSDTVAGATIGIFWGRATYKHHSKNPQALSYNVLPIVSSSFVGAVANLRW